MRIKAFTTVAVITIITMALFNISTYGTEIFGDYVGVYTEGPMSGNNLSTADDLAEGFVDYIINDEDNNGRYSDDDTVVFGNRSAWESDYPLYVE